MRVLALDTTTRAGSVAIVEDDRIVEERSGDASRTHAERLPREIIDVVEARGLGWKDIDFYAVASGPGSFTGLRIGIATIQGLAFVHGRKVVGVPALEALAHVGSRELDAGSVVSSWMDAHRREVFSASYRVRAAPTDTADRLETLDGPRVESPAAALDRLTGALVTPSVFVGDGAALYTTDITRTFGGASVRTAPLIAGVIGRLAIVRARRGEYSIRQDFTRCMSDAPTRKLPEMKGRSRRADDMSDIVIESMTTADQISDVLAIEEVSFTNPWTRAMYLAELENAGLSFCRLARDERAGVVGFCSFWRVLDELHINNLAVMPDARRRGVASALLDHVLKEGAALGARRATLEVRRSNESARLLYERFGFTVTAVRKGYYNKPDEDALVLWREPLT